VPTTDPVIVSLWDVFGLARSEFILLVEACILFLGATFRTVPRSMWSGVAVAGLFIALLDALVLPQPQVPLSTVGPLLFDPLARLSRVLALALGVVLVFASDTDELEDRVAPEYLGCLLLAVAGMSLVGRANDLVVLYLALELISIPTYVMLALPRPDAGAQEATVKYFLLSVLSSAMLLFGLSYLYGLAGTTNVTALGEALVRGLDSGGPSLPAVTLIGVAMVVAGLGFKVTAVPFHFYAPDVYQGAPITPVAFLAVLPKLAGIFALVRLLGYTGPVPAVQAFDPHLMILLWIMAAITMTLGNVLALLQDNLQRILAYSSIAHAGYMLIGLGAATQLAPRAATEPVFGVEAVLFYLIAYAAMTLGAFGVLQILDTPQRRVETVDDLAGLYRTEPVLALFMSLFLFSLIGMPLTAGFVGKFMLFYSAVRVSAGDSPFGLFPLLALLGAVNAAVAAYYYLRLVGVMYFREALEPVKPTRSVGGWVALGACAGLTLALGVLPKPVLQATRNAAMPAPAPAVEEVAASDPQR
jgi:NADH-quinone oxidoreductase subunit N